MRLCLLGAVLCICSIIGLTFGSVSSGGGLVLTGIGIGVAAIGLAAERRTRNDN